MTAALAVELERSPVPAAQVVAGEPSTGSVAIGMLGDREYGVWEMSEGAMSDIEVDELFIVVAGEATVAFEGGRVIQLAAGSVGHLEAGDRTVWTVTETLRKVYVS